MFLVMPFGLIDEDNFTHRHVAIVEGENLSECFERWDDHVMDVTPDVWGKGVTENLSYDLGSAEHAGDGFVYLMRSCDCGDDDCEPREIDGWFGHEALTTSIEWWPNERESYYNAFDSFEEAKRDAQKRLPYSDPAVLRKDYDVTSTAVFTPGD